MLLEQLESLYPARENLQFGAEVTRIAPSPTGKPHIGTALQAIIDRVIATQTGGVFILRIEDTDRKRSVEGVNNEIIESLEWLDLLPDEGPSLGGSYGPYLQSQRLPIYQSVAQWLVDKRYAYHCFCSPERLESVRQMQIRSGRTPVYDRFCRSRHAEDVAKRLESGEKSVVRLAVPQDTEIVFEEPIRGRIKFASSMVDDTVLLKSDGFPTYHLAVVVDDHFMRVTTVVRGEEWISSTPKHLLLYSYLNWSVPRILHTPLLRDTSHRKLSKRTGDTSILSFRSQGYLPTAFVNFLTRIIWSHPEDKDIYPLEDFQRNFLPSDLSKTAPVVDYDLLNFVNGRYLRRLSADELYETAVAFFNQSLQRLETADQEMLNSTKGFSHETDLVQLNRFVFVFTRDPKYSQHVLELEPERFRKLTDIITLCRFFYPELFQTPSPTLLSKPSSSTQKATMLLEQYRKSFVYFETKQEWESKIRDQAAASNTKPGNLFMTLRVALTGAEKSPPLFEVMQLLGQEEVRKRLDSAIAACKAALLVDTDTA